MAPGSEVQPWYAVLNIDVVVHVLRNSVFHPYVASLVPLCLRAGNIPYSDPAFRNTVLYATFVCLFWLLGLLNERLAYGQRRKVDASEEIVVITGGASGLGHCLAQIYAMRGTSVAVLDIQIPKDEIEGVSYHKVDIADTRAVEKVWQQIRDNMGTPSVLINNAGVVNSKPLLDLSASDVEQTFKINAISQYFLASLFLRALIVEGKPGSLVTVSSVLGHLGAARLSAYTASKAALIAFHRSVTAELRNHAHIKTILVTSGQLSTEMFSSVRQNPVQRFFGPIIEVQHLAMRIVQTVREGRGGIICDPFYARWIGLLDVLPVALSELLRALAGVDTAMT